MRSVRLKRSAGSPDTGLPEKSLRQSGANPRSFPVSQSSPTRRLSEAYNLTAALLWKRTGVHHHPGNLLM